MAVIVSPEQGEILKMRKLGLDIEPHRRRMNESQPALDERFKDENDPLRLVFVCAMWLTGFDVPSCSTVYLDKPMRNHTLMQTIARANRVFPGKHSGLIVDYASVLDSLEHALRIYGAGESGERPLQDKRKLVEALREKVAEATEFCAGQGVRLEEIETGGPNRLRRLTDAVERLTSPEPVRRQFLGHEREVDRLHRAVKPDVAALEFAVRTATLGEIAGAIRESLDRPDLSRVLGRIEALLDESIVGITIRDSGAPPLDLSAVNLEDLVARFLESARQNTILEMLTAAVRDRLERMIEQNPSRADYAARFEEMIERYNAGSRGREEHFRDLVRFARQLDEEQKRHLRENLSEEELAVFDILTRPGPELSAKERSEVRKVVQELLPRMKELLVLNWRQKQTARSRILEDIRLKLDELPESYTRDLYDQKCSAVFRHIYEKYPERDVGIYAQAG
jgi:type I restriction enzyme R subunit